MYMGIESDGRQGGRADRRWSSCTEKPRPRPEAPARRRLVGAKIRCVPAWNFKMDRLKRRATDPPLFPPLLFVLSSRRLFLLF